MLVRFDDLVSASLYASRKVDEGYYAEVIHMNAGHLYGPLSIMGFTVIVSELAAGEDDVPEFDYALPWLLHAVGVVVCFLCFGLLALAVVYAVVVLLVFIVGLMLSNFILFLGLCVGLLALFYSFAFYVSGLLRMMRGIRERKKLRYSVLLWVVLLLVGSITVLV